MNPRPQPQIHEVERAFADHLSSQGFSPGRIELDTPGFVRFDAPGDKQGKRNGFYKVSSGKFPVAWFGDWKTGEQQQWNFFGEQHELSDAEKRQMKAEIRRLKMEAQIERETKQAEVAQEASEMWKKANQNVEGHGYLQRKGIAQGRSLRLHTAKDGSQLLCVPMYSFDMNGQPQLTSLQMIDTNGSKRFLKGGRVEGTFFSLKGDASIIVICEGVATAFTIWQATGLSTVAAFNSGNLLPVAEDFRRWRPQAALLIAGDNDEIAPLDWESRGQGKPWKNAGRLSAARTAEKIAARYILPTFERGPHRDRTDFNDLAALEGEDMVKRQIGGAFRQIETDNEPEPEQQLVATFDNIQDEQWRNEVPKTSQGSLDGANVKGVSLFVQSHRLLKDRLRYNAFIKAIEVDGNEMQDLHVGEFRRIMHHDAFKARKTDVEDEMAAEANRNQYDPLREYLAGLKWDGKPRVDGWMTKYLGVEDRPYSRTVGTKFLIGAAARALEPGCKLDTMLVLEGPQGAFKSTAIRYLFGNEFFVDNLPDFHSKDSFQQLQGAWCIEVAELSALSKADVSDVKQFLSRLVDKFRPPYAKAPISVPRRTVFVGTVNPEDNGYLRDSTGARRFWPVVVQDVWLAGILRDRDQIWAEAVALYGRGEKWYLSDEDEVADAQTQQLARREVDAWEPVIREWLKLAGGKTTISAVLTEVIKMPMERQSSLHTRRVGAALRAIGWKAGNDGEDLGGQCFYGPGYHPDDDLVAFMKD